MAVRIATVDGPSFQVESQPIEVTSYGPRPDPDWSFTDANGHTHTQGSDTYQWVVIDTYWCPNCHDDHDEGEYRCVECAEVIHPGMIGPSPFREFIPGPQSFYIDDVPVSRDEFQRAFIEVHGRDPFA